MRAHQRRCAACAADVARLVAMLRAVTPCEAPPSPPEGARAPTANGAARRRPHPALLLAAALLLVAFVGLARRPATAGARSASAAAEPSLAHADREPERSRIVRVRAIEHTRVVHAPGPNTTSGGSGTRLIALTYTDSRRTP